MTLLTHIVFHKRSIYLAGLQRDWGLFGTIAGVGVKLMGKSVQQGAATTVYCAAHPELATISGRYFADCWDDQKKLDSALACDEQLQDALWTYSDQLVDRLLHTGANGK